MIYIFILLFILVAKFFLIKAASSNAIDQYYWLTYRNGARIQKKIPPDLPEYILEIKQWYPPFFGWFLSVMADTFIHYSNIITLLLSFIRLSLIIIFAYVTQVESSVSLYFAIVIYLSAPILIYYDNQINSRIFGAILVDMLVLLFFGYFEYSITFLLIPLLILTTLLLFTHKMSHQLYLFILFGLSLFYMSLIPVTIYIIANVIAILFFNYNNYLKHHIEIVQFWHRNRYKLGAHQFYESKIYGKNNFIHSNRLHGNGFKSIIKKLSLILGMLPFILFIFFNFEFNYFGLILFSTLLFIFLTSFIDYFFCLGSGALYTYNLVTFIGFYIMYTNINFFSFNNQILLVIVTILTVASIYKFYVGLKNKNKDDDFYNAINVLKNSNIDRVIAIPLMPSDEIAYRTKKKVFWGGHGFGFEYLEPYFPVFNQNFEKTLDEWNLGGIFLQKDYWPEFFEKIDKNRYINLYENSKYMILGIKGFQNQDKKPIWTTEIYKDII